MALISYNLPVAYVIDEASETLTLLEVASIITASQGIVSTGSASQALVHLFGDVITGGDALSLDGAGPDSVGANAVTVHQGAVIHSDTGFGVDFGSRDNALTNAGSISGGAGGLRFGDGGFSLINTGTIQSTGYALHATQSDADQTGFVSNGGVMHGRVQITGGTITYENFGTHISVGATLNLTPAIGGEVLVSNTGTLSSASGRSITIASTDAYSASLHNAGHIQGDIITGVGEDHVTNEGTILGIVALGAGDNTLVNRGVIVGDVSFGAGADLVRNLGTIEGDVVMAGGANTFVMGTEASVGGIIRASVDADTLVLRASATATGFDLVKLRGQDDIDFIGDELDQTEARILGNRGDNELTATGGTTVMRGRGGDDVLIASLGQDRLTGGAGADVFRFDDTDHSLVGDGSHDIITDFTRGQDLIDLSLLGDAISFIGRKKFSTDAGAELRIVKEDGNVWVRYDSDGDGTSELEIEVLSQKKLTLSDFIL